MERRQHIAARSLCVLMALLVALAAVLLYTGIGEGSLATNGVHDSTQTVKQNKPFYVLLIGSDSRKGTALYTGDANDHAQVDQHADALTLMRVDPKTYRITLVTVPSGTLLKNSGAKATRTPISDTLLQDNPEEVVSAVEDLTGVTIPYYMEVRFNGFETIVDSLETVTVDVDAAIRSQDPITAKNVTVKPGKARELYSSGALAYARAWDEYPSRQDAHRQRNVRAVEKAIIKKVLATDEGTAADLADILSQNTRTNMDGSLVRSLTKKFAHRGTHRVKIYECSGPDKTISKDSSYVVRNEKAWKHLMYVVNRGYNPAKVTYQELKQREAEEAAAREQAEQAAAAQNQDGAVDGYGDQQGATAEDTQNQGTQDQSGQQTSPQPQGQATTDQNQ